MTFYIEGGSPVPWLATDSEEELRMLSNYLDPLSDEWYDVVFLRDVPEKVGYDKIILCIIGKDDTDESSPLFCFIKSISNVVVVDHSTESADGFIKYLKSIGIEVASLEIETGVI